MIYRILFGFVLLCWQAAWAREFPVFAPLVEQLAPVVVNISASRSDPRIRAPLLRSNPHHGGIPGWLKRLNPGLAEPQDDTDGDDQAQGSGFVVDSNGYVLTNAHVVEGADEIMVRLTDRREYVARLVGLDKRTDIALLKVDASGLRQAHLGDPERLRVGDWVLAIGSPFGFDSTVTAGIVSAKKRWLPDEMLVPFIQTDVAINPGNSGGPLFNLKGEVVGVNSQIYSQTGGFMGLSFAIPIDVAMEVQAQLRQRGRVQRGRIGVLVQELTLDMADSLRLTSFEGALIGQVEPGGPAARAGLRIGDVIRRFGLVAVNSSNDLPRVVGAATPGTQVSVEYWRSGVRKQASVMVDAFHEETLPVPRPRAPVLRGANSLGLVAQEPSREQRREAGVEHGAAIKEVSGAAARSELRPGDVIIGLIAGGALANVQSAEHFNRTVNGLPGGSAITLLVRRGDVQNFVGMRVPRGGSVRK